MSEIAKWFSNKSVFVTGATGFVGKCLVVKLLRDCPDIIRIYIIIRPKKGISFEQRKTDYKNHIAFSQIRNTNPSAIDKIHIVQGDLGEPNLGMSHSDRKLIAETVSIIFHSAADVHFDRRLIDAYNTNVKGSKNILEFATEFKHLLAFILVSTAFSQILHNVNLEEKHYESSISSELMQRIIDNVDEDIIDILTPKILESHPNTYGFTKMLVEQLVYNYSNKLPTAIARPPIVTTSWKEPLPGYTEGIHGINGWCLATGRGVLRSMTCKEEYPCNVMPADIVANGIIVLAFECGKRYQTKFNEYMQSKSIDEPMYFNITEENPLSWKIYVEYCVRPYYYEYPFDLAIWYPDGSFKSNRLYNYICIVLFQILPAMLVDLLLIVLRYPPFLLKVQRMILAGSQTLEYYMNEKFMFNSKFYKEAYTKLNEIDREIFYDLTKMEFQQYCKNGAIGVKLYLLKEKIEDLPKTRAFHRRLYYLHIFTKTLLTYWVAKKLLRIILTHFDVSKY